MFKKSLMLASALMMTTQALAAFQPMGQAENGLEWWLSLPSFNKHEKWPKWYPEKTWSSFILSKFGSHNLTGELTVNCVSGQFNVVGMAIPTQQMVHQMIARICSDPNNQ